MSSKRTRRAHVRPETLYFRNPLKSSLSLSVPSMQVLITSPYLATVMALLVTYLPIFLPPVPGQAQPPLAAAAA